MGNIISRSIAEPIRAEMTWKQTWAAEDRGLIFCWEKGRNLCIEQPGLAARTKRGELPTLAWKGGIDTQIKAKKKYGTLQYLAQWQALRGEDLYIDTDKEVSITCTATGITFTFTGDINKYAPEEDDKGKQSKQAAPVA